MDWNEIKTEYIAGGTSYRKLCEKYEVSLTTLQRIEKKEKWTALRQQADDKANTKIVDAISKKQAKTSEKIIAVADKLLDKIDSIIDTVNDTQSLKQLTSAIKDIKDIKGFKSKADIREQEARIKKLEAEVNKDDNAVNEISVVFTAGSEEWNE